jgi:hypothetical protein
MKQVEQFPVTPLSVKNGGGNQADNENHSNNGKGVVIGLSSGGLNNLRHTPEGQIIRKFVRVPLGEATQVAIQLAVASPNAWGRDALELAARRGLPPDADQASVDLAVVGYLGAGLDSASVSVENCRHYLLTLIRLKAVQLIARASTPEAMAALVTLADSDDVRIIRPDPSRPGPLISNLAYSAIITMPDNLALPALSDLAAHGHSAIARQDAAAAIANRAVFHAQMQEAQQKRSDFAATHPDSLYESMKHKSAAELGSFVSSSDQHEAESSIKILAAQASQHPREVRPALEQGLNSSLPVVKVRAAAALLDMDSQ